MLPLRDYCSATSVSGRNAGRPGRLGTFSPKTSRQHDVKFTARALRFIVARTFHPHHPAVRLHDPSGNSEAQAGAGAFETGFARAVQRWIANAIELLEDPFLFVWIDANAGVSHDQFDEFVVLFQRCGVQLSKGDIDLATIGCILHPIADDTQKNLIEPLGIAFDDR